MSAFAPPLAPGQTSSNAAHAADLGKKWVVDGKTYILCKAGAALTSPGRKVVTTALDSTTKLPTWVVVATATTADLWTAVGLIPAGTPNLASGDYFLVQCGGPAEFISAGAVADGAVFGTSTTAAKCDDASVTIIGALGNALESAAGADEIVACILRPRF